MFRITSILLALLIATLLTSCMAKHSSSNSITPVIVGSSSLKYFNNHNAVVKKTESGKYKVKLYSVVSPIPLQKIHSWMLTIESTNGDAIKNAQVFVFGGMPKHGHGFPTKPRVSQRSGTGEYQIDGIKFNMPGSWEMRFNIKIDGFRDRVVFHIELK